MNDPIGTPPWCIAVWALEFELLGANRRPMRGDDQESTLAATSDHESRESPLGAHDRRHQLFRSELDSVAELYVAAHTTFATADLSWLRHYAELKRNLRVPPVRANGEPLFTESVRVALSAGNEFVERFEHLLAIRYQALDELWWSREQLIQLIQQALDSSGGTFSDGYLPRYGPGWMWNNEQAVVNLDDLELPEVQVKRVFSRRQQRDLLTRTAEDVLHKRFTGQMNEPDDFGRWLRTDALAVQVMAKIEQKLDELHPPHTRPYTLDRERQIGRDIALWTAVRIDGSSPSMIADHNAARADNDLRFRVRTDGKRATLPTTDRGVREAVQRAQTLLENP